MKGRVPAMAIAPGTVVSGYTVERELGAGGYGAVYLAREQRDGARYALKFLRLGDVGRWGEREVSVLLRLQHLEHPRVVRMLSHTLWPVGAPEHLVIVMEYVRGRALDRWAREENPTARQVAGVLEDVALALAAVHGEGVVHRDVKAGNVLVREEDGRCVLVDFGVGGYRGAAGVTASVLPPGTAEYRSPEAWRHHREQAHGSGARYEASPADDLWALGVTLYWLLTDHLPFEAPDDGLLAEAVLQGVVVPPHEVNPRVPEPLGQVCLRLLERRGEARYPDAVAVGTALTEAREGADATWDAPLCDFHGENNATTEGVSLRAWASAPRVLPRRGRRPGAGDEREAEHRPRQEDRAEKDEADAASSGSSVRGEAPRRTVGSWRGLLGLLVVLGLLGWWWSVSLNHEVMTTTSRQVIQEVAPFGPPLEAARATAPPSVAVARDAATPKDSAAMTKPSPSVKKQVQRAVGVTSTCLAMACAGSSPELRPPPAPEDCPQAALETMESVGIRLERDIGGTFTGHTRTPQVITVRAGKASVRLFGGYSEKFPGGAVLTGQLTLSDRVYGRFTEAHTQDGRTLPVCFELYYGGGPLGLERKDNSTSPDSARIFNSFELVPVRRFE